MINEEIELDNLNIEATVSSGTNVESSISTGINITDVGIGGPQGEKGDKGEKGDPGTTNYIELENIPLINDVELTGNKSLDDLDVKPITNMEIEQLLNNN